MPVPPQDHSQLPAGAEVKSDTPWISFREVSGAAIGDASVRESALSAIDVSGPLGVEGEFCFDGTGSLLLLDAAFSPRAPVWLESYRRGDGKTCAQLDRAGTLVLMPGEPTISREEEAPAVAVAVTSPRDPLLIADPIDSSAPLTDCQVTARYALNLRASPAGQKVGLVPGGATLAASARTVNWFQVTRDGVEGWITAHLVNAAGECG